MVGVGRWVGGWVEERREKRWVGGWVGYLVVVGAGEEVGLVAAWVVVHAVHAFLVPLQGEVRGVAAQPPHLDGAVEGGGGEHRGVFEVELDHHHIMGVAFKNLSAVPVKHGWVGG